tara:strand:- start:242 stop:418 length:177 start_codon:yes stop_codon:yes gene_type:complete
MRRQNKLNNSKLLNQVFNILKYKKAGKKVVRDFNNFIIDYEDLKKSYHLTFPEVSSKV